MMPNHILIASISVLSRADIVEESSDSEKKENTVEIRSGVVEDFNEGARNERNISLRTKDCFEEGEKNRDPIAQQSV